MSNNFGKNLRKLRKDNKLSQKDLAEDLEFTFNQISDWEIGRSIPNLEQICKISSFFKISLDKLIENDDYDYNFYYNHKNTTLIHKEKKG